MISECTEALNLKHCFLLIVSLTNYHRTTLPLLHRSYTGKGHGGQRRAFKVKFQGEGVNDYGMLQAHYSQLSLRF
jgi:hypothetical protein